MKVKNGRRAKEIEGNSRREKEREGGGAGGRKESERDLRPFDSSEGRRQGGGC